VTTVYEALFAVAVGIAVLAIALIVRSASNAGKAVDQRLRPSSGDSSFELTKFAPSGPEGSRGRFDQWFETAVRRSGFDASPAGATAFMLLLAVALGGGLWFWKESMTLAGLGVLFGCGIPLAVIWFYHRRYRWRLQEQLPDAYRMLAGSVRAGQTLEQALEFFAERGSKPLADEFAHTVGLMRLGMSPAAALQSTAERVGLVDFDLLASTAGLYSQTGGNLVLLFERLADSVRDRNQFRNQFFAATAQARVVAIAIGAAAPLMLLVYTLAEPEHVEGFIRSTTGLTILGFCAVSELIGIIWLWQILKVDY